MNKLLVVDDHAMFREGLVKLINHWDDFQVVGDVSNGKQAIESVRKAISGYCIDGYCDAGDEWH